MANKIKKYFWNSEKGYTAQNHAFLLFTTPYSLFWIVAAVLTLMGIPIDPMFMNLLEVMQTPMMVVLGGIFSLSVATEIRKPNGDSSNLNTSYLDGSPTISQQRSEQQEYYDTTYDQNEHDSQNYNKYEGKL